jgi:biopolymer transport protein ExbB/TolQ
METIENINFEDSPEWPLNQQIQSIWELVNSSRESSDIEENFKHFRHEIRKIYAEAFKEGQKYVWDLRRARWDEKTQNLVIPNDKENLKENSENVSVITANIDSDLKYYIIENGKWVEVN